MQRPCRIQAHDGSPLLQGSSRFVDQTLTHAEGAAWAPQPGQVGCWLVHHLRNLQHMQALVSPENALCCKCRRAYKKAMTLDWRQSSGVGCPCRYLGDCWRGLRFCTSTGAFIFACTSFSQRMCHAGCSGPRASTAPVKHCQPSSGKDCKKCCCVVGSGTLASTMTTGSCFAGAQPFSCTTGILNWLAWRCWHRQCDW